MNIPAFVNEVKGFLSEDEGEKLYILAKESAAAGPCLEIGSYCGKSTIYIGSGCRDVNSILYSIDHHIGSEEHQPGEEYYDDDLFDNEDGIVDTFREFRRTLRQAGLEDVVIPIVTKSATVSRFWAIPLAMVFIDGGHSEEAAMADYISWMPHIMPGGILAIHDIFPDPSKGGQAPYNIYKLALSSGLFKELPMTNTLGILRRISV